MYKIILLLSLVSCSASKTVETKKQISNPLISQIQKMHSEVSITVLEDNLENNVMGYCQKIMKPLHKDNIIITFDSKKYNSLSTKKKTELLAHELNYCYFKNASKTVDTKSTNALLNFVISSL